MSLRKVCNRSFRVDWSSELQSLHVGRYYLDPDSFPPRPYRILLHYLIYLRFSRRSLCCFSEGCNEKYIMKARIVAVFQFDNRTRSISALFNSCTSLYDSVAIKSMFRRWLISMIATTFIWRSEITAFSCATDLFANRIWWHKISVVKCQLQAFVYPVGDDTIKHDFLINKKNSWFQ